MSSISRRLALVKSLLTKLGAYQLHLRGHTSEHIFELYCYFLKAQELLKRGKTPIFQNILTRRSGNYFSAHAKPGKPGTGSYISFTDQTGETLDLFLNCKFLGLSNVYHSPDIVLKASNNEQIVSIYECKNHSGNLELPVYREFMGYCEEMNLLVRGNRKQRIRTVRNSYSELRPCIYTSAVARKIHENLTKRYDFKVIDKL